ncbi:MAG: 2-dehydropantoate 2-reductase [Rhodospirillales bacterium]|nr:2-dehydropantoate 2-reductase [Rhodospirillales bacterium]
MEAKPTFAVMGTGGIGGYFGGRLAAAGYDVTFIARGAHLNAIRDHGLKVLSPLGDFTVEGVNATDDPASVGPVDFVLFMVKLQDMKAAAQLIKPLVGDKTTIVPFQNGIGGPDLIREAFGPERMMGGVAYIPAMIEAPGVIRHGGTLAKLSIGEFGEKSGNAHSARAEILAAAFTDAGVEIGIAKDIEVTLWSKFIFLGAMSALTCLTRLPLGPIREDPDTRALFAAAMEEIAAVGRARGVALDEDVVQRQMGFADKLGAGMKSSMLNDLEAGKPLELEYLSGTAVHLGIELGVDTPVHRMAYAVLKPYLQGAPALPG